MFLVRTKTSLQREKVKEIIENSHRKDFVLAEESFVFVENLHELSKIIYKRPSVEGSTSATEGDFEKNIILLNSLHIWNSLSVEGFLKLLPEGFGFISSYELTEHELRDLYETLPESVTMFLPIYGRIPLMYTKNCVKKTEKACNKISEFVNLKDRKNVYFPVYSDCEKCRNIIYNSVPLSLHNHIKGDCGFKDFYLSFTDESPAKVESVLKFYLGNQSEFPVKNFTTGHFKKSVL